MGAPVAQDWYDRKKGEAKRAFEEAQKPPKEEAREGEKTKAEKPQPEPKPKGPSPSPGGSSAPQQAGGSKAQWAEMEAKHREREAAKNKGKDAEPPRSYEQYHAEDKGKAKQEFNKVSKRQ